MNIGEHIPFGKHDWIVLNVQGDRALIISAHIIEQRPYHDHYTEITWADCALRKYLNGEFFDSFSSAEKLRICPVTNVNRANQWYGTNGGADTLDKIFLLSLDQAVCQCFGDSGTKLYFPKQNQRYWFERKDENNAKRIATLEHNTKQIWWWWLRSPGRVGVKAVYVHGDGNIGVQGNNVLKGNIADGKCTGGVRPSLWLKIERR